MVSIMQKQISIHVILLIALAILSGGWRYCISDGEDHSLPTEDLGITSKTVQLFSGMQNPMNENYLRIGDIECN
jgi:hypothetical protein